MKQLARTVTWATVYGINDNGQVLGWSGHAFLYGTLVYFKVQAVKGSEERVNSAAVSATADTVGPVISDPEIIVDVV